LVSELKAPRMPPRREPEPNNVIGKSIQKWIEDHSRTERERSEWFDRLSEQEQQIVAGLLNQCAERSVFQFPSLLDAVEGPYEGIFEIVAVDGDDRRTVINPENTDLLHDLFSDVCEKDRR
jgi:hypothetical protein